MRRFLAQIAEKMRQEGHLLLITGDSARRLYQGVSPDTVEGWTNADLLYLAREFELLGPAEAGFSATLTNGELVLRLVCDPLAAPGSGPTYLDFQKQLSRRGPFTVDGLLYDPASGKFLDPLNCRQDVRERRLRPLGDERPRAERFLPEMFHLVLLECEEGHTPVEGVEDRFQFPSAPPDTSWRGPFRVAMERVFASRCPFTGLERLDQLGALTGMVPELAALKGCPQDKDYHPEGDVFTHTLECFRGLKRLSPALAWGVLLHDIGKPRTLSMNKKNLHFPGHAEEGAAMARSILRRLGGGKELVAEVDFLVRHHLLFRFVQSSSPEAVARLVQSPWFEDLQKLYLADIRGSLADLNRYQKVMKTLEPYRRRLKAEG